MSKFKLKTKVEMVSIDRLVPADWNYKKDGTDMEYEKLINSIIKDESLGVMAVRKLKGSTLEVIDGNHRLEAAKRMGLEKIPVENFVDISKATAVTISRRRNHNWFRDDQLKVVTIMNEVVFDEFEVMELEKFMPENTADLERYKNIHDVLTGNEDNGEDEDPGDFDEGPAEPTKSVTVRLTEDTYNLWMAWRNRLKNNCDIHEDSRAFEYAIIEAMNVPEDKLGYDE